MREPTYFILVSLQDGPLHGYAITKRVAELSDKSVRLAAGTLYEALVRLEGEGYVTASEPEIVDGRARRAYELTVAGRSALQAEADRMKRAARLVRPDAARSSSGPGLRSPGLGSPGLGSPGLGLAGA
jgi:PadR family transcriptional regulator, regulatory protein PadR